MSLNQCNNCKTTALASIRICPNCGGRSFSSGPASSNQVTATAAAPANSIPAATSPLPHHLTSPTNKAPMSGSYKAVFILCICFFTANLLLKSGTAFYWGWMIYLMYKRNNPQIVKVLKLANIFVVGLIGFVLLLVLLDRIELKEEFVSGVSAQGTMFIAGIQFLIYYCLMLFFKKQP